MARDRARVDAIFDVAPLDEVSDVCQMGVRCVSDGLVDAIFDVAPLDEALRWSLC